MTGENWTPLTSILPTDLIFIKRPGSDTIYYVTGANLNVDVIADIPDATTAVKGKVELATTTEAQAGVATQIPDVAGVKLMITALKFVAFAGKSGTGACTATGLKDGDAVLFIANTTDGGSGAGDFETEITVNDQIQQSASGDLSTKRYMAVCYRPSGT